MTTILTPTTALSAEQLCNRLVALELHVDERRTASSAHLMLEYLRRAALWVNAVAQPPVWPLFDLAEVLVPGFSHPQAVRAERLLGGKSWHVDVRKVCLWAVKLAALRDTRPETVPGHLPALYDPLLLCLQRGGSFYRHAGSIYVIDAAIVLKKPAAYLDREPLDLADLQALDQL